MRIYHKDPANSSQIRNAINKAEHEAKYVPDDLLKAIVNFVYKCRKKNSRPVVSRAMRTYFNDKGLLKPINFCAFIYNVFDKHCCTVNKFALNKAYQIISLRSHNNTAPNYIFEHYNCIWTECDITFFDCTSVKEEQPKEEVSKSLPDYILQLEQKIQTLLEMQREQNESLDFLCKILKIQVEITNRIDEKINYLCSIVATKNKTEEDQKFCFKIDQNEMIQYLLQNDKLNLTFKAGE